MSHSAIDRAILSAVDGNWRKVAMVLSKTAHAVGSDLPEGDKGYDLIAQRVEALVLNGRLMARGDIKNWRFSEVRLPD